MSMPDPVTITHDNVTVTSNTVSEADLRAELTAGDAAAAPAAAPVEGAPAAEPGPVRDEHGRFVKREGAPAEAAAPESATPAPEPAPGDGLPRHDPIARMKKALAQKAEAERKAAALEQELTRLRQPVTPPVTPAEYGAPPRAAASGPSGTEPQFEAFANEPDPYTAYVQAWARWDNARQVEARFAQWEAAQTAKAQATAFEQRITEGSAKYPDWQEALTQADTLGLQVSAVMQQAITQSPRAADLVHYLATHPEECLQLAEESIATPVAAAPVMRRLLENSLAPPAAAPARNGASAGTAARAATSTAKPPVTPVGSSPVVSDAPPGDDASAAEHARYWNRKLKVPGTH